MWKVLKNICKAWIDFLEIGQKPLRYGGYGNPDIYGRPGVPIWKQFLIWAIVIAGLLYLGRVV